jgi:hypothetical protein
MNELKKEGQELSDFNIQTKYVFLEKRKNNHV